MVLGTVKPAIFSFLLTGAFMLISEPTQASETTLQRIQREGVLHAATEPAFEPFEFMQNGQIVGYGTDILHEVAQRLGVRLDQQGMAFDAILPSLMAHKVDLAATTLAETPQRMQKFAFTTPIGNLKSVLVAAQDNDTIHGTADLVGKVVGIQQNSVVEPEFQALDAQLKQQGGQGFKATQAYQSYPEIQLALSNHQIDVTAMPLPMAMTWTKQRPDAFRIVGELGQHDVNKACAWALRKDDPELKNAIDGILAALTKDGTLAQLQQKWFGKSLQSL